MVSTLKERQAAVQNDLNEMKQAVATVQDETKQLWRCDDETKGLARSLVRDAMDRMQAEVADIKEEMDHKFNLQVAENKRLQAHIFELKKENKNLHAAVASFEERIKYMESEIIG